jgi:SAM-dependent methyltransferase
VSPSPAAGRSGESNCGSRRAPNHSDLRSRQKAVGYPEGHEDDRERLHESWLEEERAPFSGWDFSRLEGRLSSDEPPWSYDDLARERLARAGSALDVGTGGGERLSALLPRRPRQIVATEEHPGSRLVARRRLAGRGVPVVAVRDALDQRLPFADGSFDLVLCRHAPFSAGEVTRVLRPGGAFLTRQVHGESFADLAAYFGERPPWPFWSLSHARELIEGAGLEVRTSESFEGTLRFHDVGAIVYFLRAVAWIVPGFSVARHRDRLLALQDRLDSGAPLAFTKRRFLLLAENRPAAR